MSEVAVKVWVERIDDQCCAACAEFREVYRGQIFGCGTMLLFKPGFGEGQLSSGRAKDRAVEKLKTEIVRGDHVRHSSGKAYYQHNRMPLIGYVRDNNRA